MQTTRVSMATVKSQIADLLKRVRRRKERIIIEMKGKPQAAIVSLEDLARLEQMAAPEAQAVETASPTGAVTLEELLQGRPLPALDDAYFARMDAWLAETDKLRAMQRAERGMPQPDSTELLREVREET